MSTGKRIRDLRIKRGFTQEYLAKQLGMGRSNFGHIERDRNQITVEDAIKLADLLGTTTDYILHGVPTTEEMNPEMRMIARGTRDFDEEQRKRMLEMIKLVFRDEFKEEDD
jgi:HTH-type transcriptional regulator, competence development regulator